ncbi:MAG: hypothetical protein H0X03_06865 [Nitrosopumilus sp.]|nr:hypothetical protein [Nitrosopumilus sp.]
MGNIENAEDVPVLGNTVMDKGNNSTTLIIPKEFVKELDIESSKVSMSLLVGFNGNRHLVVTKYHNEVVID